METESNQEVFEKISNKIKSLNILEVDAMSSAFREDISSQDFAKLTPREIGQSHYKLAKIYYDKADLVKAEKHFLNALGACELPQDAFAMMKISGFLIRVYSELLKQDEVNNYIELSRMLLDAAFSQPGWSAKAEYFFYMGATKTYIGDFREAVNNFSLSYKKAQEANEPEVVAKSLLFMAHNNYLMNDFSEAQRLLGQLEQLLSILNKGYLKASMNLLYGNIYTHQGEAKKALRYFKFALEELNKKSCWNLQGYIFLGMGKCYKKMGDYKKALLLFEVAQSHTNSKQFRKLSQKIEGDINEVNDSNIDFVIDKTERSVKEKSLGTIDFKHRFVLLEILYLLASNPGKHFDKEDLSRDIWKEEYNPLIHDKLIYTSISRLRKLIEPGGEKNKYIIRGKDGYTFSPNVKVRFCQNTAQTQNYMGNIEIGSPL